MWTLLVANKLKVLGFAGSLRAGSYNKALLRAAENLLPENLILEIYDINGIAPFNQWIVNNVGKQYIHFINVRQKMVSLMNVMWVGLGFQYISTSGLKAQLFMPRSKIASYKEFI